MIGRNSKWNMSTADDSRQISSIVEKENGKTFVGLEEVSGVFTITIQCCQGGTEGTGGSATLSRRIKLCLGVAGGLSRTFRPNNLEGKEKIIKKRKPQSLCLKSTDAKI